MWVNMRPRTLRRRVAALCAMLAVAGTGAAVVCVPARADTTDDAFIHALDREGIEYPSRAYALRAGWAVCHELDNGTPVMVVIYGLSKVSYLAHRSPCVSPNTRACCSTNFSTSSCGLSCRSMG